MAARSTLRIIAEEIALAFEPLEHAVADLDAFKAFLHRLGWIVDSMPPVYQELGTNAQLAVQAIVALGDDPELSELLDALEHTRALVASIRGLSVAPAGVDPAAFLAEVGEALIDLLLADYLVVRAPGLYGLLSAAGVIETVLRPAAGARESFVETRFNFRALADTIADPKSIPARVYGWGTAELDRERIASDLLTLFSAAELDVKLTEIDPELRAGYQPDPGAVVRPIVMHLDAVVFDRAINDQLVEAGLSIIELPAQGSALPGLIIQPMIPAAIGTSFDITEELTLEARAGSDLAETVGFMIRPSGIEVRYPFQPGRVFPSAGFGLALRYAPSTPSVLLGGDSSTRLELQGAEWRIDLDVHGTVLELAGTLIAHGLKLIVPPGQTDSFLSALAGDGFSVEIPLAIRWSNKAGFSFEGGTAFRAVLAPHLKIGPARLNTLAIDVEAGGDPVSLAATIKAGIAAKLGPIAISLEGVGLALAATATDGNFGPLDLSLGFEPPSGAGLSIAAGPIQGGGFLAREEGRYSGALALNAFDVALSAYGLIDTAPPEGGYSLVGVVSAEFQPTQLGLGFTLNGVGGLLGIHRRIDRQALKDAVLGAGLADIFFPRDPVAQAARLLTDLGRYFPPQKDRYVFGPAAKIGWGTPTLVEADLAVLLEVPDPVRVMLLGKARSALPSAADPLIELNVDLLGELDVRAKRVELLASLRDSKVVGLPIRGQLAMRLDWGDPPDFILSIGGFHSGFAPPPDFPALERLTIPIGTGENPRLDARGFLAVTSNSAQVGAEVTLHAAAGAGLNIKGNVGFEALFIFRPFSFRADFWGDVALRRHERRLAGVHLDATITGPTPWHVFGEACLSLWLTDLCVDFDVTIGPSRAELPPGRNPWPELEAAIGDPRNWSTAPRAPAIKTIAADGARLVDPSSSVTLRQRVLPLERRITRYAGAPIEGPPRYDITEVAIGGAPASFDRTKEWFAPGQYEELSEDQRLSREAFERMTSGVSVGEHAAAIGVVLGRELEYETIILREKWSRLVLARYLPSRAQQLAFTLSGAAAKRGKFAAPVKRPPKIELEEERFVVVSTLDLSERADITIATTRGAAFAALAEHLAANPAAAGTLEVLPVHELLEAV